MCAITVPTVECHRNVRRLSTPNLKGFGTTGELARQITGEERSICHFGTFLKIALSLFREPVYARTHEYFVNSSLLNSNGVCIQQAAHNGFIQYVNQWFSAEVRKLERRGERRPEIIIAMRLRFFFQDKFGILTLHF